MHYDAIHSSVCTRSMTTTEKKTTPKGSKAASGQTTKKAAKDAVAPSAERLRIRVRAYEHKLLDVSVKQIIDTAFRYEAEVRGPVPLPTEIKKYTVNRAAFVHKDAREQFEMRIHKRLIEIVHPNAKVVEALTNLSLPAGVNIDVKMV